jgi:phosphinothricin acetyltransferase
LSNYGSKEKEDCWLAALSRVSKRPVYKCVTEVSVYVVSNFIGQGIETQLLKELIEQKEKEDFRTLQSSIFSENIASFIMHLKFGFRKIGQREKIAKLNGEWKDNIIMERRRTVVGIE